MARFSFGRLACLAALGFTVATTTLAQDISSGCDEAIGALPEFESLTRLYTAILSRPGLHCTHATLNSCAGERLDTHWHFRAVDADLMQKEMEAWRAAGRSGGREPIAMVDGLFGPHLDGLLVKPPAGIDTRTNFGHHLSGHAAQTIQFIGGAAGLGLAPDNPIFGYDIAADEVTAESSKLRGAALDACAAGQRIINVSLNSSKHSGNTAEELSDLVTELAKQGCVLVKAAGNDGVKDAKTLARYEEDFPFYLSVGATRRSGGVAAFSDSGSVYAPGQGLAVTLPPSQIIKCSTPKAEAVEGGTSYSAPIVSAITAQVREVLMTSAKFRKLFPPDQVRAIVSTVRAAADTPTGNVSGLKAVRGAMEWVAKNGGDRAPALAKSCGSIPAACLAGPSDCGVEEQCSQAFRTALALCPERLAKEPIKAFLAASSLDPWLGLRVMDSLSAKNAPALPAVKKLVAETYNDAFWKQRLVQVKKPPFPDLDNFFDLYARMRLRGIGKGKAVDRDVFEFLLLLQSDPQADSRNVARSYFAELVGNPEAADLLREGARTLLIEKQRLNPPAAVDLIQQLNDAQGGTPAMDDFTLDLAQNFPASHRNFLRSYLETLALGKKRPGNLREVVGALMEHAKTLPINEKILINRQLYILEERNRAAPEDLSRWRKTLGL